MLKRAQTLSEQIKGMSRYQCQSLASKQWSNRVLAPQFLGQSPRYQFPQWAHSIRKPSDLQVPCANLFLPLATTQLRCRGYSAIRPGRIHRDALLRPAGWQDRVREVRKEVHWAANK